MNADKARIFISYSHRGNGPKWKAALLEQLKVFTAHNLIEAWDDETIPVGWRWEGEIEKAIHNARLAVLLLTKEALESEFILERELVPLSHREANDELIVIPIVCEPCSWNAHPWLQKVQVRPFEAKPLSAFSEGQRKAELRKLAMEIAGELSRAALADLPKFDQPLPPGQSYLDKCPLTRGPGLREETLIGREQELALLDLAFAQPHTAIVSLVAWGGVGKTMLVQHWLRRLQREGWFGARRVYAWSFYSQGTKEDRQAPEDTFLAHAVEWFGVKCEPTLSPWDKGRLLADAAARERTLFILDGVEPLQYPPGPMGGQFRAPGVQSLLKQLARTAGDVKHRALCVVTTREPLTDLAQFQRRQGAVWGSVLRVDLDNLTEEAGAALLHHAGANRASAAEIRAGDAELLAASREVDGHALTLKLLGRFLARAHGGDIHCRDLVKFEEADRTVQGGTTFKMLAELENWFAKSGEFGLRQLAVLRILGLFDRPADAGCIEALRRPPVIAGLTTSFLQSERGFLFWRKQNPQLLNEDLNTAISFLADFGLVVVQADTDNSQRLLDCHPLIREHFAKTLREKTSRTWRYAHRRLYEYLKDASEQQPTTIEGLQPLYQAVAHGCLAGMHKEALSEVYNPRILRRGEAFSINHLGVFGMDLAGLAGFFEVPWRKPVRLLKKAARSFVVSQSGFDLMVMGRLREALEPLRMGLEASLDCGDWPNAAVRACNVLDAFLLVGDLSNAIRYGKVAIKAADRIEDSLIPILPKNWLRNVRLNVSRRFGFDHLPRQSRAGLAHALHQAGDLKASSLFDETEALLVRSPLLSPSSEVLPGLGIREQLMFPYLVGIDGFRYCDLLLAEARFIAWSSCRSDAQLSSSASTQQALLRVIEDCRSVEHRAAQTLKWAENNGASRLSLSLDRLTQGRAALYRAIIENSEKRFPISALEAPRQQLSVAVDSIRSAGTMDYLPQGLLTRAWLRFLDGNTRGARTDLDEAWDIAQRGPMRLHLAEIHLHRAHLFFRENSYPWKSPQDDLTAAEKLINDCGYHRRDEELADAKRAILGVELT